MNGQLYFTDDQSEAAYLCTRGYTLLGAVDTENFDNKGNLRLKFALTHTKLRDDPNKMNSDILSKIKEFSSPFSIPGSDDDEVVSFRIYYHKLRMVKRALHEPVSKKQVENVL